MNIDKYWLARTFRQQAAEEGSDEGLEFASPEERGDFVTDKDAEGGDDDGLPKQEGSEESRKQGAEEEDVKDDKESKTAEGKDEEEGEGEKKGVKDEDAKGIRIPKFRFDAVAARAKAAEERAAELEAKLQELQGLARQTPPSQQQPQEGKDLSPEQELEQKLADIDARMAQAIKDGEADIIPQLMAESRQAEKDFYLQQMEQVAKTNDQQTAEQIQEAARLDLILTQLEEQFPIFDENSDQYDQDANDKVLEVQQAYIAAGRSPSDALVEAVNLVLPTLGYNDVQDPSARPTESKPQDRSEDVKRNTRTARQQPPDLDSVGDDSDKAGQTDTLPDPLQLTDSEWDALPEETKKRLRGDFV